jgi:hypothetical protein
MREKPTTTVQFINYVWLLLRVSALHCHLQGAFLVLSERCLIEEQSIEYYGRVVFSDVVCGEIISPRITPIDTTRPSTIFYRLLLNLAPVRRH